MRKIVIGFIFVFLLEMGMAAETLNISGAGPSTVVVQLLADAFSSNYPGYQVIVPPKSIKHAGGMQWAQSGNYFGRTGRPMSNSDKSKFPALEELIIAEVPIGFAIDKSLGISSLTLKQWEGIYKGEIKNWKEIGGPDMPVTLLGRAPKESVFSALRGSYPFIGKTSFFKIYNTEDQMVRAISSIRGSIGFSSVSVLESNRRIQVLSIPGFSASLSFGLVYDKANKNQTAVQEMCTFIKTPVWDKVLKNNGFSNPNT